MRYSLQALLKCVSKVVFGTQRRFSDSMAVVAQYRADA